MRIQFRELRQIGIAKGDKGRTGQGVVSVYPFEDPFSDYDVVFIFRRDHVMDAAFRNFIALIQSKNR